MTDYQKMYQEKLTTPDKIAQQVQSGWLLGMDTATSQTPAIMTAIAEHIRNSDITGVKVQALLDAYPFEFYTDPTLAGKMTGYSWFSSSAARKAVNAGYADIIPAYYRDFPTRIRTEYDYDAVCVEVAPPDSLRFKKLLICVPLSLPVFLSVLCCPSPVCSQAFSRSLRLFPRQIPRYPGSIAIPSLIRSTSLP